MTFVFVTAVKMTVLRSILINLFNPMSIDDNRYFIKSKKTSKNNVFKMNFRNFVIFVSVFVVIVRSSELKQKWNNSFQSADEGNNKQYIGTRYNLLPTGVRKTKI